MRKKRTPLWKTFSRHGRTSVFGIFIILIAIMAILMYYSNEYQREQIHHSYCGELGFYGKSLTLMKDNTFKFSYHGCSQTNGYISGSWTLDKEIITLLPDQPDELLDSQYKKNDNRLLPMNLTSDEGFVSCNDYDAPWQRETEE